MGFKPAMHVFISLEKVILFLIPLLNITFTGVVVNIGWFINAMLVMILYLGVAICEGGITIQVDDTGRETGEAFIEVGTDRDVEKALDRHKKSIGHRYDAMYIKCITYKVGLKIIYITCSKRVIIAVMIKDVQ